MNAAGFAEGLRPQRVGRSPAERRQFGDGGDGRVAVVAEAAAHGGGDAPLRLRGFDQLTDDAADHLKRALPDLLAALTAIHRHSFLGAVQRQFGQQAGFAASRFAFHENQRPAAGASSADLLVQLLQFAATAHERRFGQRRPTVVRPDHARRFALARLDRGGDVRQIGQHGFGRLIALVGIVAQESLDELVEGARDFESQASQLGDAPGHVLEEDRSHVLAVEGSAARKTLEQNRPHRIEIGGLGHAVVQRAGLFRRTILRRLDGFLVAEKIRRHAPRQVESHEHHSVRRPSLRNNDVGGANVAVKHFAGVNVPDRGEETIPDRQDVRRLSADPAATAISA